MLVGKMKIWREMFGKLIGYVGKGQAGSEWKQELKLKA